MQNLRPNVSRFTIGEDLPESKYRRDDRYKCPDCRDYGWVSIWNPSTLQQASKDPDACDWKKCVVRCKCDAPGPDTYKNGDTIPIFGDRDWHINANSPDAKARAAQFVYRPPNYNDAFEQFE